MHDMRIAPPTPPIVHSSVAAVWLYEGLWNKVLGRAEREAQVVAAVPSSAHASVDHFSKRSALSKYSLLSGSCTESIRPAARSCSLSCSWC